MKQLFIFTCSLLFLQSAIGQDSFLILNGDFRSSYNPNHVEVSDDGAFYFSDGLGDHLYKCDSDGLS